MTERQADLCVIGAGPGGYVAAIKAAQLGLKTIVVERDELGGVCLNRGCIPTKAMLRSANLFETFKQAAEFGILADNVRVDFGQVIARRDKIVKQLTGGVGTLLQSNGIELVRGHPARPRPGPCDWRPGRGDPGQERYPGDRLGASQAADPRRRRSRRNR